LRFGCGPFADRLRRVKFGADSLYDLRRDGSPRRPPNVDLCRNSASQWRMIGERTENALARIHAALDRIERAGAEAGRSTRDAQQRHERLRAAVGETLRDLDLLIGSAGQ